MVFKLIASTVYMLINMEEFCLNLEQSLCQRGGQWGKYAQSNDSRSEVRSPEVNKQTRNEKIYKFCTFSWVTFQAWLFQALHPLFSQPSFLPLLYNMPKFWVLLRWMWKLVTWSSWAGPSQSMKLSLLKKCKDILRDLWATSKIFAL